MFTDICSLVYHFGLAHTICSTQREKSDELTKSRKVIFKLMNNSCYGNTHDCQRNRVEAQLKRSVDKAQRVTDKSLMQSFEIFDENLAAVTLKQMKIYRNTPTIVEACVLELAKIHLLSIDYRVMKNAVDCQLIYSDTDLLLHETNRIGLHKNLAENANLRKSFDFSNYPENHPLYHNGNKTVTLLFKDVMAGKILETFVGLNPIKYSIKYRDYQKLSAMRACRFAKTNLKHNFYKIFSSTTNGIRTNNIRIGSILHQMEFVSSSKISFSASDDYITFLRMASKICHLALDWRET